MSFSTFKVNINTDKIIGGEVLLRWSKSEGIPLYEYISLLIEYELNGGIDSIKLDRMFFTGKLTEERKLLLKHIFEIAKNTKVDIISEGIEDKEYIDYLKEIGGKLVQGFYYYKPMPLDDFQKLLDKQFVN